MKKLVFAILFFSYLAYANEPLTYRISEQTSLNKLLANISPNGTKVGAVVASPSRSEPNYWYHWVRDAALVMRNLVHLATSEKHPILQAQYAKMVNDYAYFVRDLQFLNTVSGFGEPKYHVDGSAFTGPWGRPQNDGPALRAMTFIQWANHLLEHNGDKKILDLLYNADSRQHSIIKADLEYTAHNWQAANFDYWEEVKGLHFANMSAKRKALVEGAKLAKKLNDPYAADFYNQVADQIKVKLLAFWQESTKTIVPTIERVEGIPYKTSGIDISSLLGVNHSLNADVFDLDSYQIQSTVNEIIKAFQRVYPINQQGHKATLIGRYPEDKYNGYDTNGEGHGWFLATFAVSEYFYKLANHYKQKSIIRVSAENLAFFQHSLGLSNLNVGTYRKGTKDFSKILSALIDRGDDYIRRADFHASSEGYMSEQSSRYNGYMQGAEHLTWSYASHLSALWARNLVR